jgi:hypothetical protein
VNLDGVSTVRGLITLNIPLPCRYCHLPSYLAEADDEKQLHPLHPCCRFWIEQEGKATCVACASFNSRRAGRAGVPGRSGGPASQVRPAPQKKFDEDDALLLVLGFLRRSGDWVEVTRLLPMVDGRADLLAQLSLAGIEQHGNFYRIPHG